MPRLLIICTAFPPATGGGSVRNLLTARGLAQRGWNVTVLTGDRRSPDWHDESPLTSLPLGVRVVRALSPDAAAVGRRRAGGEAGSKGSILGAVRRLLRPLVLTWLLIPDADAPWIPFAVVKGRHLLAAAQYDAMLTSGPPHSAHVVGRFLRRTGLRWVVDSQDPWADHPFPLVDSRLRKRLDRWLEAHVFSGADVVTSATEAQAQRFRAAHTSHPERFATLPGGYDELDFVGITPERSDRRRILHVGSFYGARSPAAFFEALAAVARDDPEVSSSVEVLLAGYADAPNEAIISDAASDPRLHPPITYVNHFDRRRSIAAMLGADILLLVTDPLAGGRDLVPLKTFEYLRAGRPILALVPEGETATLLRRTGGAVIAHPSDAKQIELALRHILSDPPPPPDPQAVHALSFDATLSRLETLLGR